MSRHSHNRLLVSACSLLLASPRLLFYLLFLFMFTRSGKKVTRTPKSKKIPFSKWFTLPMATFPYSCLLYVFCSFLGATCLLLLACCVGTKATCYIYSCFCSIRKHIVIFIIWYPIGYECLSLNFFLKTYWNGSYSFLPSLLLLHPLILFIVRTRSDSNRYLLSWQDNPLPIKLLILVMIMH